MRKILFTLLFINALYCSAQKWCPPGAQWTYNYGKFYAYGFDKLTYEKDTIVLQQNCKKITGYQVIKDCCPPDGPLYYTDEPVYTYAQNDTVFFYDGNMFKPVYFFNVKVGDTLHTKLNHCEDEPGIIEIVDSIGKVKINNDSVRFYRVKFKNYLTPFLNPPTYTVIEIIGCIQSFMNPYITCIADDQGWNLDCYHHYNFTEYDVSPETKCGVFTSVDDPKENLLSISPNPTSHTININNLSGDQIEDIILNNIAGIPINFKEKNLSDTNISIDVNSFQNGMYILQITYSNGKIITKKFIKHSFN